MHPLPDASAVLRRQLLEQRLANPTLPLSAPPGKPSSPVQQGSLNGLLDGAEAQGLNGSVDGAHRQLLPEPAIQELGALPTGPVLEKDHNRTVPMVDVPEHPVRSSVLRGGVLSTADLGTRAGPETAGPLRPVASPWSVPSASSC